MNIISSSYGNDSCALIQWAFENKLTDVLVIYCDTGWSAKLWPERVLKMEAWVSSLGFNFKTVKPAKDFEALMLAKKGFPNQRYQWCSKELKIIPFLRHCDEIDPHSLATILIGKRRVESTARRYTPEFIECSEYHGNRRVWHPLYMHDDKMRNDLLSRAGLEILPHRSQECAPCVNANRHDFMLLTEQEIQRVEDLEEEVGKNMFRPARHQGAQGIREVVKWAKNSIGKPDQDDLFSGCSSGYCGI